MHRRGPRAGTARLSSQAQAIRELSRGPVSSKTRATICQSWRTRPSPLSPTPSLLASKSAKTTSSCSTPEMNMFVCVCVSLSRSHVTHTGGTQDPPFSPCLTHRHSLFNPVTKIKRTQKAVRRPTGFRKPAPTCSHQVIEKSSWATATEAATYANGRLPRGVRVRREM